MNLSALALTLTLKFLFSIEKKDHHKQLDSPMHVLMPISSFSILKTNTPSSIGCGRRRFRAEIEEIRVCTNRTCRRQGSFQTLETLTSLAPANVSVKSCGCLGRCGAGPNLVALPSGVLVSHCGTAAQAAEVLVGLCGGVWDTDAATRSLEALALRKKAVQEFNKDNFAEVVMLLSQAIELKPIGGTNILYKDRSVAKLALGKHLDALEDAREALALAPHYSEAHICEGDAFLAINQVDLAEKSYLTALEIDPSIRRSKSFKIRIAKLQEKLATSSMS